MPDKRGKHPVNRKNQFKPGESGNPEGRKGYERSMREYAMDLIRQPVSVWKEVSDDEREQGGRRLVADMLLGAKRDGVSIIDIIEQLEGKATQRSEVTGADGAPLFKAYGGFDPSQV